MITTVPLKFEQRYSRKTKEPEDWVLIAPADDVQKTQTWRKVASMMPKAQDSEDDRQMDPERVKHMRFIWDQIKPAYLAWKEGVEIPLNGTPLIVWAAVGEDTISQLQRAGIKTVEAVADAGDSVMEKIRVPNARQLPKLAKQFLEMQNASDAAEKMEARDAEIAALREQMAELTAAAAKRGPGRPRKEDAAE